MLPWLTPQLPSLAHRTMQLSKLSTKSPPRSSTSTAEGFQDCHRTHDVRKSIEFYMILCEKANGWWVSIQECKDDLAICNTVE
jgi:hypothetical protein